MELESAMITTACHWFLPSQTNPINTLQKYLYKTYLILWTIWIPVHADHTAAIMMGEN
jgi:hypothetical protein